MSVRKKFVIRPIASAAALVLPLLAAGPIHADEPAPESRSETIAPDHAYLEAGDALGLEVYGLELRERATASRTPITRPAPDSEIVAAAAAKAEAPAPGNR